MAMITESNRSSFPPHGSKYFSYLKKSQIKGRVVADKSTVFVRFSVSTLGWSPMHIFLIKRPMGHIAHLRNCFLTLAQPLAKF